ncbi:unnamed protein product, partial [Nesidiocoris tenuis]
LRVKFTVLRIEATSEKQNQLQVKFTIPIHNSIVHVMTTNASHAPILGGRGYPTSCDDESVRPRVSFAHFRSPSRNLIGNGSFRCPREQQPVT